MLPSGELGTGAAAIAIVTSAITKRAFMPFPSQEGDRYLYRDVQQLPIEAEPKPGIGELQLNAITLPLSLRERARVRGNEALEMQQRSS